MKNIKICIFGLGYVGLPVAILLSSKFKICGFDIDKKRIIELKRGFDRNLEFKKHHLIKKNLNFSFSLKEKLIKNCNVYIITVPTPVTINNKPDITLLKRAFKNLKNFIKSGDTIIIESTVAPGTVEELSKINFKRLYNKINICFCPERINPGDKLHTLGKITKVISSNTKYGINVCKKIYKSKIKKIFVAKNIQTAEMAKIIENTQRDVNIALMNEFSLICSRLKIDIRDVISACQTKWNYLDFYPGLVGGHCVPVDPYYLIDKVQKLKLKPSIMIEARKTNESYIKFVEKFIKSKISDLEMKILFSGISFKNEVVDTRNSKNLDLALKLSKVYKNFYLYDPYFKNNKKYKFKFADYQKNLKKFDIVIIASSHSLYKMNENKLKNFLKINQYKVLIDLSKKYHLHNYENFYSL